MYWAITGKTAAEIIHERADHLRPNMGLTNWRGPKVRKPDVVIAKNYLAEDELMALNEDISSFLDGENTITPTQKSKCTPLIAFTPLPIAWSFLIRQMTYFFNKASSP